MAFIGLKPGRGSTGLSAKQIVSPMCANTGQLHLSLRSNGDLPSSEFFILQTTYLIISYKLSGIKDGK